MNKENKLNPLIKKTLLVFLWPLTTLMLLIFGTSAVHALKLEVKTLQKQAYFTPTQNGLYQPLDLKETRVEFNSLNNEECGRRLIRKQNTLHFTCTLDLPPSPQKTRLFRQVSPATQSIQVSGGKQKVNITVSSTGQSVSFTTEFDTTGIDFGLISFNEEFFRVYAKMAQLIILEAMKQPLAFQILEQQPTQLARTN